jgi:hypothetical protein
MQTSLGVGGGGGGWTKHKKEEAGGSGQDNLTWQKTAWQRMWKDDYVDSPA